MMNDEIKEKMTIGKAKKILRGFLAKDCYYDTHLYYAIPYLLNYITNLQESEAYYYGQYKDYKSRCEKAVEYMKQSINESQLIFGWGNIQRYHDNEMNY